MYNARQHESLPDDMAVTFASLWNIHTGGRQRNVVDLFIGVLFTDILVYFVIYLFLTEIKSVH